MHQPLSTNPFSKLLTFGAPIRLRSSQSSWMRIKSFETTRALNNIGLRSGTKQRLGMAMFRRMFARPTWNNLRAPHMKMWGFEAKRARKFTRILLPSFLHLPFTGRGTPNMEDPPWQHRPPPPPKKREEEREKSLQGRIGWLDSHSSEESSGSV